MKNLKYILFYLLAFMIFIMFDGNVVKADYYDVCNEEIIEAENSVYRRCGNNNIYLMQDNKKYSSYLVANRDIYKNNQILYAGVIDGIDTFYSLKFSYYSVIYDDRGLFTSKDNIWSDISINGVVVYSGEFDDVFFVDQSASQFVNLFYNEVGTYLIRQHIGDKVYSAIRMIVVDADEYSLNVNKVMFGDNSIDEPNLIYDKSDLVFYIDGGKYGFSNQVKIKINECNMDVGFSKELVIDNDEFDSCINENAMNNISITLYNGLNGYKTFKYSFRLHSEKLFIELEDSYNALESTSRRIVIKAIAGFNKNIDEEYCLYYWSESPNDKLDYENFMTNYELSDNKGSYTASKGVILRDSVGTYYLYAMAKDENSSVVVRSNEYVLKESGRVNKVITADFIFVGVLCLGAALPVFIYLIVRGKDTL